jgi:hypothetical protein
MRTILSLNLCIALLFALKTVSGQVKPDLQTESVRYDNVYRVFANDGTNIYLAKFANADKTAHNDLVIEKRDMLTNKVLFSTILDDYHKYQQQVRVPSSFVKCVMVKDKIYAFYEYINNNVDTLTTLLQIVDANSGTASETHSVYKVFTKNNRTESIIEFSPDQKYFMVCADPHSPFVAFTPTQKFFIEMKPRLYETSGLKPVWEKPINGIVNSMSSKFSSLKIDNYGNLYTLSDNDDACTVNLFPVEGGSSTVVATIFNIEKRCKNGLLDAGKDGNMLFSGVVEEKGRDDKGLYGSPAFFISVFDGKSRTVLLSKEFPFDQKIYDRLTATKIEGKEWSQKAYNDFVTMSLKEYDGGYYLVTDHVFSPDEIVFSDRTYKDIIIAKVSKGGELGFMKLIPRRNRGGWEEVIKTEALVDGQNLLLLYGENTKLAAEAIDAPSSASMPLLEEYYGNVILASASENGNFNKKILFENKKNSQIYMGAKGLSTAASFGPGKILLPLQDSKGGTIRFMVLSSN